MKIQDLLNAKKKNSKKDTAKKMAIGAGIGTAVGVVAGLLFAPKSGKETREQIAKNAKEAAGAVKESIKEVKEKIEQVAASKQGNCCETAVDAESETKE